jgi:hypothetical protein
VPKYGQNRHHRTVLRQGRGAVSIVDSPARQPKSCETKEWLSDLRKGADSGAEPGRKVPTMVPYTSHRRRYPAHQFAPKKAPTGVRSSPRNPQELRGKRGFLRRFASPRIKLHQWPRRDLNPHEDYSPRDFKSRASADSATRPAVAHST